MGEGTLLSIGRAPAGLCGCARKLSETTRDWKVKFRRRVCVSVSYEWCKKNKNKIDPGFLKTREIRRRVCSMTV